MRHTGKNQGNERAVSPVVGVMLMLVVVIIIAAIVSGFAGGLMSSNNKAPQATIQATYSVGSGILLMYHAGGDELPTSKIYVVVRGKDEENGGYSGTMSRITLNRSMICNSAGSACWAAPTGYTDIGVAVWRPGETMIFNDTANFKVINTGLQGLVPPSANDIGKAFNLEIDSTDGKTICKTDVKIGP